MVIPLPTEATSRVVPTTTLLTVGDPTLDRDIAHLAAKSAARRAIMLIDATNGMLALIPLLTLPRHSTPLVLSLKPIHLIGI